MAFTNSKTFLYNAHLMRIFLEDLKQWREDCIFYGIPSEIDAQDYAYSLIVFAVAQFHQNVLLSRLRTARSIIKANKGKLRKLQYNPENLKHKSVKVQAKAAAMS